MPGGRQLRQALKNDSWSEADSQHAVICCDLKKVGDPGAGIGIRAGHDETPNLPRTPSGRPNARIRMLCISLIGRSRLNPLEGAHKRKR